MDRMWMRVKTGAGMAMAAAAALALTGCISDNMTWLRARELDLSARLAGRQAASGANGGGGKAVVEGPATLTVGQGGKATLTAGE